MNLQVLSQAGTEDEQRQAPKVLRLLRSGRHTMLVMLLLGEWTALEGEDGIQGMQVEAARQHARQHISAGLP